MAKRIEMKEGINGCRELEEGNILFFEKIPFSFPQDEIDFLLRQKQTGSKRRKNIAYKPDLDRITNHDEADSPAAQRLHQVLKNYSKRVSTYLGGILPSYAEHWKLDYASFRPFQEKGRALRTRARNDLLHVDAFPTRPVHGARILRFFTNINPIEPRRWMTSLPFGDLAKQFSPKALPFPKGMRYCLKERLKEKALQALGKWGVKVTRPSPYDRFMLKMHNFLKENQEFQANTPKDFWEFPPLSCWAVFTDLVSHAALSGQYALEQTFLVPEKGLLYPEKSPVSLLERLSHQNMVDVSSAEKLFCNSIF